MGASVSAARCADGGAAGKCPVDHKAREAFVAAAVRKGDDGGRMAAAAADADAASAAPAGGGAREVYNVYGQRINPDNMMPLSPNQLPAAGQDAPLPQARVQSSIPKGGTARTWAYPSPQQFYNSLVRKQKAGDGLRARDVELVVAIHNNMNEHGWAEVQRWEALRAPSAAAAPKLLKFRGRPDDLSPLARLRQLLGFGKPFDRHDWIVERANGERQRYVLDYYHVDNAVQLRKFGVAPPPDNDTQLVLDVRPALDSVGALADRARVALATAFGITGRLRVGGFSVPPDVIRSHATHGLPAKPPPERLRVGDDAEFQLLASLDSPKLRELHQRFDANCAAQLSAVKAASDVDAPKAHTALRLCMGNVVCPSQAERFRALLEDRSQSGDAVDRAWQDLDGCVERFSMAAAKAMANERLHAKTKKQQQ